MTAPTFVTSVEPASNWGSTSSAATRTTGSFSVVAGDVLVVVAASENQTFTEGTPTGGSLTWSSVKLGGTASSNGAGVNSWTATVDADKSMTVAITCGGPVSARFWGFAVYVFRGSDGVGASAITEQTAGATNVTQALTTTAANSAILAISADWNAVDGTTRTWATINSVTPTLGNGLERSYFRDVAAYAVYTGYWNDVGATGSKTAGVTAPTGQRNSIIAIEVKGTTSVSGPAFQADAFQGDAFQIGPPTQGGLPWHTPLSQPTLRAAASAALIASGLVWSGFTPAGAAAETVTVDKWHAATSQPVRRVASVQGAADSLTAPPAVPLSGIYWFAPLAEPQRRPVRQYEALSWSGFTPPPSFDWFAPLSHPVRRTGLDVVQQPTTLAWSEFTPAPTFDWLYGFAQPQFKPARQQDSFFWGYATPAPSVDWQYEVSRPQFRPARQYDTLFWSGFTPAAAAAETITLDKWFASASQPQFKPARQYEFLAWSGFTPAAVAETITVDKWFASLSQPQFRPARDYPAFFWGYTETVTLDKWFAPFAQPTRLGGQPTVQQQALFAPAFVPSLSTDWVAPFAQPVRETRGLHVSITAGMSWSGFTPDPETITLDKWFVPLGTPVRLPIGLDAFNQQWLAFISTGEAGTTAPAVTETEFGGHYGGPNRDYRSGHIKKRRKDDEDLKRQLGIALGVIEEVKEAEAEPERVALEASPSPLSDSRLKEFYALAEAARASAQSAEVQAQAILLERQLYLIEQQRLDDEEDEWLLGIEEA